MGWITHQCRPVKIALPRDGTAQFPVVSIFVRVEVDIYFDIAEPDRSVGENRPYVSDWRASLPNGRKTWPAQWTALDPAEYDGILDIDWQDFDAPDGGPIINAILQANSEAIEEACLEAECEGV